jgi:hypothetical protein
MEQKLLTALLNYMPELILNRVRRDARNDATTSDEK